MEEFKSWEEMSTLEQYACQYWDMYKDAYGVRPRGVDTSAWTEAEFEMEFASLGAVIEREEADRKVAEAEAIVKFEDRVDNLMNDSTTRKSVVKWLMDADDVGGDVDYFEYLNNLPYGYLKLKEYV